MMNLNRLESIEQFASGNNYPNLLKLTVLYRKRMTADALEPAEEIRLRHGLSVCRLLIDLNIDAPHEVADICLSAALIRGIAVNEKTDNHEVHALQLHPEILELTYFINMIESGSPKEKELFYAIVQEDKQSLMVSLADRATFLAKLHELPEEESLEHVRDTRQYFFSMCIFAIEAYPDLAPKIRILMRKIKGLCEVYDILTGHHQAREQELSVEILRVQEDNAGLRSRIAVLQG